MSEIGLVSCTKSKKDHAAPPAELYMPSTLFEKARAYVEATHDEWYILSAKHHLLDPYGPPIESYDETLSGASVGKKREWAATVADQLKKRQLLGAGTRLVIHAGRDYYEELLPILDTTQVDVRIPTDGLRYGETLSWYNEQL